MVPYFLLLLIPLAVKFTAQGSFNQGRIRVLYDRKDYRNPVVAVFFIYLLGMLVLRKRSVGVDLSNYYYLFYKYTGESFSSLVTSEGEILYKLMNWIVGQISGSFRWILVLSALLSVIPIFFMYNEDKRNGYLKILIFLNSSVFVVLFSALRQSIAVGIGVICYYFVKNKKPILFFVTIVIAMMFHHSAFILLLMYPVYHARLNSRHLWFLIPLLIVFFLIRRNLFILTTDFLSEWTGKYESVMSGTGAFATFLMYVVFLVFSYIVPDEKKMTNDEIGLRNFLMLATALQSFASLNNLAMRMNYFYIVFIPCAMCKFIEIPKRKFARVAILSKCILCIFFTLYFIYTIMAANGTRNLLGIVPYESVWR